MKKKNESNIFDISVELASREDIEIYLSDKTLERNVVYYVLTSANNHHLIPLLKKEYFTDAKAKLILELAQKLINKGVKIDKFVIIQELISYGYNINDLTDILDIEGFYADVNLPYYILELKNYYVKRRLYNEAVIIHKKIYSDKTGYEILEGTIKNLTKHLSVFDDERVALSREKRITKYVEEFSEEENNGLKLGFPLLDEMLGGLEGGELVVIAGRPAMGKTAFMLNIANNISDCGIFSLEMSEKQLILRFLSMISGFSMNDIKKKRLSGDDWNIFFNASDELMSKNIIINDVAGITLDMLKASSFRMINEYKIKAIIIDYLQLMNHRFTSNMTRENVVSEISRGLKSLAKELNIPIIVLSQLNRAVETRASKRPVLSDLRESGSIEQDADRVLMLYRPEYYGLEQDDEGNSLEGVMEVIIAKNRHGEVGSVLMDFDKSRSKIKEKERILYQKEKETDKNNIFDEDLEKIKERTNMLKYRANMDDDDGIVSDEDNDGLPF